MAFVSFDTWSNYYEDQDEVKMMGMVPMNFFDKDLEKFTESVGNFQSHLQSNTFSFVLLNIQDLVGSIIHLLHAVCPAKLEDDKEEVATFLLGNSTKTCRAGYFNAKEAVEAIDTHKGDRGGKPGLFLPNEDQFSKVKSSGKFADLKGKRSGKKTDNLSKKPSCFVVHPALFFLAKGKRSFRPTDLALTLLSMCRNAAALDPLNQDQAARSGTDLIELSQIHELLIFLWACENKFVNSIKLHDVPKFGNIKEVVSDTLKRMRSREREKLQEAQRSRNPIVIDHHDQESLGLEQTKRQESNDRVHFASKKSS